MIQEFRVHFFNMTQCIICKSVVYVTCIPTTCTCLYGRKTQSFCSACWQIEKCCSICHVAFVKAKIVQGPVWVHKDIENYYQMLNKN